jgi:hypothetical protein
VRRCRRSSAKQQRGFANDSPGDRDPLTLAAGKLLWSMLEPVAEADAVQCRLGALTPFALPYPGMEKAVGHVVTRRYTCGQVEPLEAKADAPGAQAAYSRSDNVSRS